MLRRLRTNGRWIACEQCHFFHTSIAFTNTQKSNAGLSRRKSMNGVKMTAACRSVCVNSRQQKMEYKKEENIIASNQLIKISSDESWMRFVTDIPLMTGRPQRQMLALNRQMDVRQFFRARACSEAISFVMEIGLLSTFLFTVFVITLNWIEFH